MSLSQPAAGYVHRAKQVVPGAALTPGTSILKWYDIAPADAPVDAATRDAARAYSGRNNGLADDRGFVILHRCGASFYFLLIAVWRGSNELWEAVHYRDDPAAAFAPFDPAYPPAGALRPTFCVWELGAMAHEAAAWSRYLASPRHDADARAWEKSVLQGEV